jgi:hypothetical protein
MKYDFNLNKANIPCHLDIEKDIKLQKNGVFTFTIRTNQSIIQDYVCYSNATANEYNSIISATEPECKVSRHSGVDNNEDALRGSDGEHQLEGWGNTFENN